MTLPHASDLNIQANRQALEKAERLIEKTVMEAVGQGLEEAHIADDSIPEWALRAEIEALEGKGYQVEKHFGTPTDRYTVRW